MAHWTDKDIENAKQVLVASADLESALYEINANVRAASSDSLRKAFYRHGLTAPSSYVGHPPAVPKTTSKSRDFWDPEPYKNKEVYKVIVLPDMQCPYEDKYAVNAVEQYMADETWDEYINLGDFMDLDCISHWNKGKPGLTEGKTVQKDFDHGNAVLDRHQKILRKNNPDARFVYLEGNHDARVLAFLEEYPQLRGSIEIENGLHLQDRDIKWVKSWSKGELYKLGHAYFTHGRFISANHAKKMVESYGVNIFYGHCHDLMSHSKVLWGKDKTIVGQSLGCLCRYDQSYIENNPTNWQHAFGVFFFRDDGDFTYYVPRIIDNKFIGPNGKLYTGK